MAKKAIEPKGNLTLAIDERGLEAKVTFTKGPGRVWTLNDLFTLMSQRGITEGYKTDEVTRLFNLIPDKPSPYTFKIAEGLSPVAAKPETVDWLVGKIPRNLASYADNALAAAKPPSIHIDRRNLVKRQKTVEIKSKLPFLKPRIKQEEVTEESVSSERVYVDPTVEKSGYSLTGEKLGTVQQQQKGVAGRSISGQILPEHVIADPDFYIGPGIVRRQDDLFSEYEGFVRIGSNWADLVPFETHGWDLSFSDDKVTCYLSFDPGDPHAAPPTAEEICEEAKKQGYNEDRLIPKEEITALVARATTDRERLVKAPLTASRDSGFDIFVSDDRLKAVLNVSKGTGRGSPLIIKRLGRAIKESKLVGLNYQQIQADVSAFIRSDQTELTGYVLAEGSAPEQGPERSVDCSVRFVPADEAAELKRQLAEVLQKTVSGESLTTFPVDMVEDLGFVEAEQRLATISPPATGKPGKDVFGQQLPGEAAKEPAMETLENVERKGNVIISTTAGLLQKGWKEEVTYLRVIQHADASVAVRLGPAKMSALVSMSPHAGSGRPLRWEQVEEAVADAGVAKGVNLEILHRAHERCDEGRKIRDLIFARGNHPESSSEGEVEVLVELASGGDVTIRRNGSADFRNLDLITTVTAGTKLARLHSAVAEKHDGWDVLGETSRAEQNETQQVDAGTNVSVQEEEGGTRVLVAEISGELLFENNRFEVRAGHTVDGDVDLSTGNVKFPGTVTVTGSVRTGFAVVASGDILVGEMVESALLSADGNIVINQGVKGAAKAVLRAKNSVGLLFAEQATILSVGNVQAKNSLVHCTVKTNAKVRMIGDRGRILGGTLRCRAGLETDILGSEIGVRTSVAFGQNYLIADQIENEEKEMAKAKEEIARIDFAMKDKEKAHEKSELEALHTKKLMMLKMLEKRGLRIFTLRERFEEHQESEVIVRGTMYPGVVFESHGRSLEIETERKSSIISFNPESGRIDVSDLDTARPASE